MRKRFAAAGALALAVALVTSLLASARHLDVRDANDTRGVLDIKRAAMAEGKAAKWRIRTWRSWKIAELWDAGFFLVYLDTFGGSRADYYALASSNGRRMIGALYRDRERKRDVRVRSLRTGHPAGRLLNITVPMGQLRRRDSSIFRWHTLTMFSNKRCKRFCLDRAPNRGWISEPGPAPSPTLPTPTPTVPTPTPSP